MEQRLRLVQGGHQPRSEKRTSERRRLAVAGQIVWKDARGNTKLTEVVTRDVSEHGVSVECLNGAAIPLYRLVYFQVTREARHQPGSAAGLAEAERAVGDLPRRRGQPGDRRAERIRAAAAGGAGARGAAGCAAAID